MTRACLLLPVLRALFSMCDLQMGFQDFLQKCEILEFDFDPKAIQQGRLHARDMQKFKVSSMQLWASIAPARPIMRA